jgi:hypothetical protein
LICFGGIASAAGTGSTVPPPKPITLQRAVLNVCSTAVSASFKASCESHSNYQAVNLRLAGDGGCMEMCCKGHPSTGYTCVSDPNAIRDRTMPSQLPSDGLRRESANPK